MSGVSESQYYMWRTLFALAHVDHVVSAEEVRFMAEALEDIPFSDEQHDQLVQDTKDAQDAEEMFQRITDVKDQAEFFKVARDLVHVDGDYGPEEQDVMLRLKEIHMKRPDLDQLIGNVDMALESNVEERARIAGQGDFKKTLFSFREKFLKERFGDD